MEFHGDVVVRRGKKYWTGSIVDMVFKPTKEIENIEEFLKSGPKLIDISIYSKLIGANHTKKEIVDIRRKLGYSDVWLIEEESPLPNTSGVNEKAWKKWYFRFIHPMCQKCTKECKQSYRADVFCTKFNAIKEK